MSPFLCVPAERRRLLAVTALLAFAAGSAAPFPAWGEGDASPGTGAEESSGTGAEESSGTGAAGASSTSGGGAAGAAASAGAEPAILLLEVVRDGRATGDLLPVREQGGRLLAPAADARAAGLDAAGEGDVDLTALGAELDAPNQRLVFGGRTGVSLSRRQNASPMLPAGWGGLLDYDVQGVWSGRPGLGGVARLRGFGPPGLAETGVLLAYDGFQGTRVRRLDTTFTALREDGMLALRAGDVVTGGLGWTRPLRLGGAQASRDFSLRPDLVTAPLPGLGGRVAVPSTVDVLVDGTRRLSADVPAGPFELRDLPVLNGAGQVTLAVRDAAGRETLDTLPFYAAAALLLPGESTWSASAGAVRRGYGTGADGYGALAAAATLRHGITSDVTGEAHAEIGGGAGFGGVSAVARVGSLGLLGGSLAYGAGRQGEERAFELADTLSGLPARRAPRAAAGGGRRGSGLRWGASFERQAGRVSFSASTLRSAGSPRDVAAALGEPLPRAVDRAGLSLALGSDSSLGVGWTSTRDVGDPRAGRESRRVDLLNVSWTGRVTDNAYAYASGYSAVRGGFGSGLVLGLTFSLGGDTLLSAQAEKRADGWSAGATAARPALAEGDTGWRLGLEGGAGALNTASVEHRASFGTLGAAAERLGGRNYGRVTARGAVVAMDGLHAVPPVYDSFAVVDADGQEGVTVLRENQPVGRTGADGRLLVTGLSSASPNRLALDVLDLPMDVLAEEPERRVRLPPRAGAVLRFPAARRGMGTVLRGADGEFLPLDTPLEDEAGHAVRVGLDGQAWWPEGAVGRITAALPGGRRCATAVAAAAEVMRCE